MSAKIATFKKVPQLWRVRTFQKLKVDTFPGSQTKNWPVQNFFRVKLHIAWTTTLFHDESPYHVETSPFICFANQWTGFYTTGTTVMKELISFITSRKFLKDPKYITTS